MTFIETVPEDEATGRVSEIYDDVRGSFGFLANWAQALSIAPEVHDAWADLNRAIKRTVSLRLYELATVAAARELRSTYCSLAHGKVLVDKVLGEELGREVLVEQRFDGLDEVDVAVMELARKVVRDATSVEEAEIERLRSLGLTDREILGVVAAAAGRCFLSKTTDALGVQPDAEYRELMAGYCEALSVGRPIEAA